MKLLKIAATALGLSALILLSVSCSNSSSASTVKTQTATVRKGSLSETVTGTGNLALSRTKDLAFDMAGTVQEVLVKAGDLVTEEQELVKLDTSEWDKQVKALEKALTTAKRNLASSERQIVAKELALRQAQLDVQTAEDNLSEIAEVKAKQDLVDAFEYELNIAQQMYQISNPIYWGEMITYWQARLASAKADLRALTSGSTTVSSEVALKVAIKELAVERSKMQLEDAQIALDNAQLDKEDAEEDVKDAQSDLDEKKALSPIIKAPFAGFITKVNVEGGDEVLKGTVAMQLADPNQFEANIMVSEQDIFSIKLGGGTQPFLLTPYLTSVSRPR